MTSPELELFIVRGPAPDFEHVGVVEAKDAAEALLLIPPNHGIELASDPEAAATSIDRILDLIPEEE